MSSSNSRPIARLSGVLSLSVAFIALEAAASPATGQEAPTHCTLETLHGTMAWSGITSNGGVQWSGSGQESYDGKGHMRYYEFQSYGVQTYTYTGTGTYTIDDHCIATVTYDSETVPWVYFVSADGDHYYWNNNQGTGAIGAGRADRISRALLVP
jgi:hypothetical protein